MTKVRADPGGPGPVRDCGPMPTEQILAVLVLGAVFGALAVRLVSRHREAVAREDAGAVAGQMDRVLADLARLGQTQERLRLELH